ncbi:MAG TPA: hydrogenase small subunit [Gammaproteobacteria bacterium]|nr:hydrogenase small subunit [Gammaproteobacteria bacterium]
MDEPQRLGDFLLRRGISRRAFMKFCTAMASAMAMPPSFAKSMAKNLESAKRESVIYLSFQECTGCAESLTRSHSPTLETLIFDFISLDYQDTLMAAAGRAAERAKEEAIKRAGPGGYLVVVDGSVPLGAGGAYSASGGKTSLQILGDTIENAAAVICVGTCSSFGGIPYADPNPTDARSVSQLMEAGKVPSKPVINVSGCPPIPVVIAGTLAHYLTFGRIPELDHLNRPKPFFGETIHDRCYRRPYYEEGKFAQAFDDEGARSGWCLYELGCKGPITYNACATTKWNGGTSFPVESGHGCLGCSEPGFWDGGSFYKPLSAGMLGDPGTLGAAAAAGAAVGAGAAWAHRRRNARAKEEG